MYNRIIAIVFWCLAGALQLHSQINSESRVAIDTITTDGAWCWFSDPRAIYVHGTNPGILTGWVTENGSIQAAHIDKEGEVQIQTLAKGLEIDDHAHPAFLETENGKSIVFYTKHFDEFVRIHHSSDRNDSLFLEPVLFDPFDEEELEKFPLRRTTYANPLVLEQEPNKVFCFGRWTGFKPNMMISSDGGKTFGKSKVIITNYPFDGENRPYVKYYSNGQSKIHIVFTDGHPRNELENSVYYTYYENGAFWRIDGSKICSLNELPFEPKDATLVYKANKAEGKSWVFDIASDKKDMPVILYTRYPDDKNHMYYYAMYKKNKWEHIKICNSGSWFPETPDGEIEREPNYSGGMSVHPLDASVVYVSEKVNNTFEIVKYQINKNHVTKREPVTRNSGFDNVRPFVPRNMKKGDPSVVLWMQNKRYIHYTDYRSSILQFRE